MKTPILISALVGVLATAGAFANTERVIFIADKEYQFPYVVAGRSVAELRMGEREVSAYTLGNPLETDDTPCVGASNLDLCAMVKSGVVVYASNEFPLHTRISVDGVEGIVLDRMNSRYRTQVDKAMLDRSEALTFGRKQLEVIVLK